MGTISTAKLAGISLILGPVITVVCYFIQQLVIFADVEWGNAASRPRPTKGPPWLPRR